MNSSGCLTLANDSKNGSSLKREGQSIAEDQNENIFTFYFSGTGARLSPTRSAGYFYSISDGHCQGFDGPSGYLGKPFGYGLGDDVNKASEKITEKIALGKKLIVNCYGMSRGGIAALLLAKKFAHHDPSKLEVNLALLDPVPGNLLMTAEVDLLDQTFANQVKDLSSCHTLKHVFTLYTHLSSTDKLNRLVLPPVIPLYPATCRVESDVIIGEHNEGNCEKMREITRARIRGVPSNF